MEQRVAPSGSRCTCYGPGALGSLFRVWLSCFSACCRDCRVNHTQGLEYSHIATAETRDGRSTKESFNSNYSKGLSQRKTRIMSFDKNSTSILTLSWKLPKWKLVWVGIDSWLGLPEAQVPFCEHRRHRQQRAEWRLRASRLQTATGWFE